MKKQLLVLMIGLSALMAEVKAQTSKSSDIYPSNEGLNYSQGSEFRLRRTVNIENDSKVEEVLINIEKNTLDFALSIESRISKGKLTIEIYDSSSKKQGHFTIETQMGSEKKEDVNGQYRKSWKNVPAGQWMVRVIPTDATAKLMLTTSFLNE